MYCLLPRHRVILALVAGVGLSVSFAAAESRAREGFSSLPPAASGKISAALGKSLAAYKVRTQPNKLLARNPPHNLSVDFTKQGMTIRSGRARWNIGVASYGYGKQTRLPAAVPEGHSNRVQYRRGTVTEWYVNGPIGIEQGFAIDEPPGANNGSPLIVTLRVGGNVTPRATSSKEVALTYDGRPVLRYAGLTAYDSTRRQLPAWIELRGAQLRLEVDDRRAQYPIVIDPWIQTAELTSSDGQGNDQFGWSVAVDGDTVVVGAPTHAVGSNAGQGAAYVFVKPDSGWADAIQTAELSASGGAANDYFGSSVAINGDTIVVGAGGATVNGYPHQGVAYVFVKPAGGWRDMPQAARLAASDGYAGDDFGAAVAINGDNIAVGAPYASIGSNTEQGAAYVFVKPSDGWVDGWQTAKLTASDGSANDVLGVSVALEGDTVLAGASGATIDGNANGGAAYVFVKPPQGWSDGNQSAKLTASDVMPDDYFGVSVALNNGTIVVGGPSDFTGSVYVFVPRAGKWNDTLETAKLTASGSEAPLLLGTSVAISGDTVISGAVGTAAGGNQHQGILFLFVRPPTGWSDMTQTGRLTASDGAEGDYFGRTLALSGSTAVAGAPFHTVGLNSAQGSAYVFQTLNKRPGESSLDPDSAVVGGPGLQVTVNGQNFVDGSVVNWAGSPRDTQYVSSTQLQVSILASDVSATGKFKITTTNPPPGGGTSNALTFTVTNPVPQIETLNPDHATVGDPALTLTVDGSGFVPGCRVQANGVSLDTTFISDTEVTAIVPSGALKQAGTTQITVVNGPPGGGRSNPLTFTINNPVPQLVSLQPDHTQAGGPGFTLTIYGSGFVSTSQVKWNGSARATTYFGPGKLQATIKSSDISSQGTAQVTVANPGPGGGKSNSLKFTITP